MSLSFHSWTTLIFILLFALTWLLHKKKKTKYANILIATAVVVAIVPEYLPGWVYGKWNAIKSIKGKQVTYLVLRPYPPNWKNNLTDTIVHITNNSQIDQLLNLLENTEIHFLNNPFRVWETEFIVITNEGDSLFLRIKKTTHEGIVIFSPEETFRNDKLGEYLEKIARLPKPANDKNSFENLSK